MIEVHAEPLKIVHSDVVGPYRTSIKWYTIFRNLYDCTRWGEVYFLREKSGIFEFKSYQAVFYDGTLDWKTDKVFALDNGRKYCNIGRARLIPGEERYRAQIDSSLYFTAERDG